MKSFCLLSMAFLIVVNAELSASAQRNVTLASNAALRYWAAFSVMQDSEISAQQAKKLNAVLDGRAPYDDSIYGSLVQKNELALKLMASGTAVPTCDWGLDYSLGENVPVEYARKGLVLGRLNVIYVFHLLVTGNKLGAIDALAAGLRFSHDIANGGSLFATLAAKDLLVSHLRAIEFALHTSGVSAGQRQRLQTVLSQLGPEVLDWQGATRRDLEALRGRYAGNPQASAALTQIIAAYASFLRDPSKREGLQQAIKGAPPEVGNLIPSSKRVLQQKQELSDALTQLRSELHG